MYFCLKKKKKKMQYGGKALKTAFGYSIVISLVFLGSLKRENSPGLIK